MSFKLQLFLYSLFDVQKMDLCKKDVTKLLLEMLRDARHRRDAIDGACRELSCCMSFFVRACVTVIMSAFIVLCVL